MKRFIVLLCLVSVLCISVSAYSSVPYTSPDGIPMVEVTLDNGTTQLMTEGQFLEWEKEQNKPASSPAPALLSNESSIVEDDTVFYDSDLVEQGIRLASDICSNSIASVPNGAVVRELPSDGSFKAVLQSVFGVYEPVEQMVTIYLEDGSYIEGTEVVQGISGVDWTYVLGVLGFFLILYSFFRLLGVFFR